LCRCFVTSILKSDKELAEDTKRMLRGEKPSTDSVNSVKGYPKEFTQWLTDHREQIAKAQERGTLPYFIKDNQGAVDGILTKNKKERVEADFEALKDAWFDNYLPRKIDIGGIEDNINNGDFDKAQQRIDSLLSSAERHKARTADDIRRIQDQWDERKYGKEYVENVHKIEQSLGMKREKRMTHFQANSGHVNPNYALSDGYKANCSTCSGTYILRTMGFNVQAKPCTEANANVLKLSHGQCAWEKWVNGRASYMPTMEWMQAKGYEKMTNSSYLEFIEENTQEAGIYEFLLGYSTGGGHSTLLRRLNNGHIEIIDQQLICDMLLKQFASSLTAMPIYAHGIMRVDNALFNAAFCDIVDVVK
jgi:hypothetical protein